MKNFFANVLGSMGRKRAGIAITILTAILLPLSLAALCNGQTEPAATTQAIAPMSQDELPDAALGGDLLAVVVLDFEHGDKTAWNNTWMVISGGKPTTRALGPDDPLPMGLDQAIGPMFKANVLRLVYALSVKSGGNMDLTLCFRLRDGASEVPFKDFLRKNMGGSTNFDRDGAWLIKRISTNGGPTPRALPLNPQADEVRQELNCWGDDVPMKVVYLTSPIVKKHFTGNTHPPDEIMGMMNLYWDAKYIFIGARLGIDPQVEIHWVAPDPAGADALIKEFIATRERIKEPGNASGLPSFFGSIFDQSQPVREDNVVRYSLGRKELTNIFGIIIAASMNQNQNSGEQTAAQSAVAADWAPTDAATDSTTARMRLILSAISEYDREHHSLPGSLDDLVSDHLVPGPEVFHDARTGKDGGFIYLKPDGTAKLADITSPAKTAILFEEKDGMPDKAGLVGYADGKVGKAN